MLQYFEIPSIDKTVRKAMLDGIVQRVLNESGVSLTDIVYTDEYNTQLQPGSEVGEERELSFGGSSKTFVEFNETRNEMNRISRGVGLDIDIPFFHDKDTGVRCQPIGTLYDVEVTLTRRSRSKDDIQRWCNRMNSMMDMGRYSLMTETEFYYILPPPVLMLLHDAYVALNARTAKYPDFKSYLKAWFSDAMTVVSNVAGGQKTIAIQHALTRIEVVYDIEPPTEEKEEKYWSGTFRFTFEYVRPEEIVVAHPLILNQTQIHERWFPDPTPPWLSNEADVKRTDRRKLQDASTIDGTINRPWLPNGDSGALGLVVPKDHEVIFGSDLTFDPDNMTSPVTILGPNDLPFEYLPHVGEYIVDCITRYPDGTGCLIQYIVYINNLPVKDGELEWVDGTLKYNGVIVIENTYYITVSVVVNWATIDYEKLHVICKHAKVVEELVNALLPDYTFPPGMIDSGYVPPHIIDDIVDTMAEKKHQDGIKKRGIPIKSIYTVISVGAR